MRLFRPAEKKESKDILEELIETGMFDNRIPIMNLEIEEELTTPVSLENLLLSEED